MTFQRVTGGLLVVGFVTFLIGALMFVGRGGLSGGRPAVDAGLIVERVLIMAAVVVTAVGFVLLTRSLDERPFAWLGTSTFLLAAVLIVVAETLGLRRGATPYGLVVAYVILAFLAQASIGVAILRSDLLSGALGWAAIGWNLTWMLVLLAANPEDVYFPVLHHVIPLAIGISLLARDG